MGSKTDPIRLAEKRARRMGAKKGKITVHGDNPHMRPVVIKAQLEQQGYIVYDESSVLTEFQVRWIMGHIPKARRVEGMIPLTPGENTRMKKEEDDARPPQP